MLSFKIQGLIDYELVDIIIYKIMNGLRSKCRTNLNFKPHSVLGRLKNQLRDPHVNQYLFRQKTPFPHRCLGFARVECSKSKETSSRDEFLFE